MSDLEQTRVALLTALQEGVEIEERPFARMGRRFGLTEDEVLESIRAWCDAGVARRFGAVFDGRGLGYASTLCAAEVPPLEIEALAARLVPHPGITHCYEREAGLNLWFTLTAPMGQLERELTRVREALAPRAVLDLPAVRRFKIAAVFDAATGWGRVGVGTQNSEPNHAAAPPAAPTAMDERHRAVVRLLQGDLAVCPDPFGAAARRLGMEPPELMELLAGWKARGVLRRVCLVVRHQTLGFAANCLCVWRAPPETVEAAGLVVARDPRVTHCYERRPAPGFPFNLFAMLHAHTRREALAAFRSIEAETGLVDGRTLWSVREFKKSSPVFFSQGLLLAAAGTSSAEARAVFDRIEAAARASFPLVDIRWAFTSAGVRRKLERAGTPVQTAEQALSALQADGIRRVAVVSLHLSEGMEYGELARTVDAFRNGAGPLKDVALGRPLLADAAVWERVVRDVLAGLPGRGESGDVVVLAAHGSPDPRGAASFRRAAEACRRIDARLFLGMMIGSPSLDDVLRECRRLGAVRVWLAPCLVAAGYSVSHEIAGDGKDSWKSRFEQAGMHVLLVPRGLGEHDGVVSLWMEEAGRLIDE